VNATPFGHYQLRKLIGRGGMGEVYRAYDTKTDRIVALKVLPLHLAEDATFQQRFRRESQAAAGLNDPHVVPIHGYGEIDGRLYLDMRLIEGRNLGTMLEDSDNPLGAPFAVKVVEQVATALDAAHEAGLIHRDVKPSNVLITDREFVYLIDFGLARTAGEKGLTTAGNTLGTLAYMAPERFDGAQIDPRADIYALTCVLYECITGSRPYPAESYEQQIKGHMLSPPPRPSAIDPKLAAFDDVIAKGMAKKPAKRYQTAGELAAAARRALETPVRTTGRSGKHSRQRTRGVSRRHWLWRARWCWWPVSARSGCGSGGADRGATMRDRRASRRVRRRRRRWPSRGRCRRSRRRCPRTSGRAAGWWSASTSLMRQTNSRTLQARSPASMST
jgi:serine/threonine protein kinase